MNLLSSFVRMGYVPHAKQMQVHNSNARFKIVAAGDRGGKSMLAGAEIAHTLMLPDKRIWCVSSQYELAEKEFDWALNFLAKYKVDEYRHAIDICHLISPSKGSRIIKMPWGSYCQTKSTEKPQSLLGEELDLIVLGEASQMGREPWERMLRARLGPRKGRLLAISTPNSDAGLFSDMFSWGLSKEEQWHDWEAWQFSTLANPYFDKSEWEVAKKELDEKIFQEQYEGKFVSRRGHVFNFDAACIFNEVTDEMKGWGCAIGLVKGFTNPFAVVWVLLDSKNATYYVFQEIHQLNKLAQDIVPQMKDISRGYKVIGTIIEADNYIVKEELTQMGVSCISNDERKYNKKYALIKKIQCMQNVMKQGRLKIHSSCEKLMGEIQNLKWQDPPKEQAEKAEQETPLTKYLNAPLALAQVLAFCEGARGVNIYGY
jgi:hypothetical protein